MAAPVKNVLNYYNWECNAFDNDVALKKLSMRHGPLGETVYRRMLDLIYANGFYLKIDQEDIVMILVSNIGSKWINESKVVEILMYCSDIGLFEKNLVSETIWTSYGIQKRYFEIMVKLRRTIKIEKTSYLLCEDVLNEPNYIVNATLTGVIATFTPVNATFTSVNADKRKENKIKVNETKVNEIKEEEKEKIFDDLLTTIRKHFKNFQLSDLEKIQECFGNCSLNQIKEAKESCERDEIHNIDYLLSVLKENH